MVGTGYPIVQTHALAHSPDPSRLRIWVGVFDQDPPDRLEWSLDGTPLDDADVETVRPLTPADTPGVRTHSGIVRLPLPRDPAGRRPLRTVDVTAHWGRHTRSAPSLRTRPLPAVLEPGLDATFRVMLVSCFYRGKDKSGKVGVVARALAKPATRPDLVLTVGDQVYLDNPPPGSFSVTEAGFAETFEEKYRANWQTDREGFGYAEVLASAPVAAVPDDHEFWNNYPAYGRGSVLWPATLFARTRDNWRAAARAMYDAFQLGADPGTPDAYSHRIDVDPLSFFLLDSRTFREITGGAVHAVSPGDLARFESWVDDMLATPGSVPVLVTGPSLLQGPADKPRLDQNFADVVEYPAVLRGLLRMMEAGRTPLLLTGDVHYPRVADARLARRRSGSGGDTPAHAWPRLHEVISSPASIVLLQRDQPSKPRDTHLFDIDTGYGPTLACRRLWPAGDLVVGNHVAVLEFGRRGSGVQLTVRYHRVADRGTPSFSVAPIPLTRQT